MRPNPYYPSQDDAQMLQVLELYKQICDKCRQDDKNATERAKADLETEFLTA